MIFVLPAIENDVRDPLLHTTFAKRLANDSRSQNIPAIFQLATQNFFGTTGGCDRLTGRIVDDLRGDVLIAAEHRQTQTPTRRAAYLVAHSPSSTLSATMKRFCNRHIRTSLQSGVDATPHL